MNNLGIDYGLSKVGTALAVDSSLAEPFVTVKRRSDQDLINKLCLLIDRHKIDLVIVGLPDGGLKEKIMLFARRLQAASGIKVKLVDEEYSTKQVQFLARQAGRSWGKIKRKEHEWAATVILQSYLDTYV
jgi:putative transcription antitermination factor YqgF